MKPENILTAWSLLTATAGLLAFLVSLYALVGRERKSPYLINSIFGVFLICLLGAMFDLASLLIPTEGVKVFGIALSQAGFLQFGLSFLLFAFAVAVWKVWTISIRLSCFVDPAGISARLRSLAVYQWYRDTKRKHTGGESYQHHPAVLGDELETEIERLVSESSVASAPGDSPSFEIRDASEKRSLALALRHQGQANKILYELAVEFLKNGYAVQYMTASRHPIEFVEFLKSKLEADQEGDNKWKSVQNLIVVIDAYTPHFGFMDSINSVKTEQLRGPGLGVQCLSSPITYAGLHTASSDAFKLIKKSSGDKTRKPALVIYEDCHALVDLESVEQYRIFVRHVLPSERLWDGMFTVFAETAQPETEWSLVSSYASMMLDMRRDWPADQSAA